MNIDTKALSLAIAEKLRDIATRPGVVPVKTGALKQSHTAQSTGASSASVIAQTPYARPVHFGRQKLIIKPRWKKVLAFPVRPGWRGPISNRGLAIARFVTQPARKAQPWLADSIPTLKAEGFIFVALDVKKQFLAELATIPNIKIT